MSDVHVGLHLASIVGNVVAVAESGHTFVNGACALIADGLDGVREQAHLFACATVVGIVEDISLAAVRWVAVAVRPAGKTLGDDALAVLATADCDIRYVEAVFATLAAIEGVIRQVDFASIRWLSVTVEIRRSASLDYAGTILAFVNRDIGQVAFVSAEAAIEDVR